LEVFPAIVLGSHIEHTDSYDSRRHSHFPGPIRSRDWHLQLAGVRPERDKRIGQLDQAMKKGILLWAVLPWLCPTLHGQVWCPPGAEWHFEHWGQFGNQLGSVHVQYAADTMVQGVAAKRLSSTASGYDFLIGQPYVFDLPNIITKSDQAQVSRWNGTDWVLLFDLDV